MTQLTRHKALVEDVAREIGLGIELNSTAADIAEVVASLIVARSALATITAALKGE
jgi:hypothetical protein